LGWPYIKPEEVKGGTPAEGWDRLQGGQQVKMSVNPAAVYAELEDGAVILNVDTGVYYGLDRVGARIWQILGAGATADNIVAKLQTEYAVEVDVLRTDVAVLLRSLQDTGLLQVAAV
jgi:hypothetical protein